MIPKHPDTGTRYPLTLGPGPMTADGQTTWRASVEAGGETFTATRRYPAAALAALIRLLAVALNEGLN